MYTDHERHMLSKIVELEVTGKTMYLTNGEFEELKERIEEDNESNRPFYSIRKIDGCFCETYIVK